MGDVTENIERHDKTTESKTQYGVGVNTDLSQIFRCQKEVGYSEFIGKAAGGKGEKYQPKQEQELVPFQMECYQLEREEICNAISLLPVEGFGRHRGMPILSVTYV